ncbi:MAG: c-type cytochrome [Bryobacterales bacterium]|nr:c-type cytochrome [Bryobacterales bacterium]
MRHIRFLFLGVVVMAALRADAPLPGDARIGAEVFRQQKCVVCHSVNGRGGKTAPDLGKRIGRGYAPSTMASLMWNHAPVMWAAMEKQGIARPALGDRDAANLFAYFWADRFFDRPGDAGRGMRAFRAKGCAGCHAVNTMGTGPAIARWDVIGDPIALAAAMWNHMGGMRQAAEAKGLKWPSLEPQEMTDIVVYVQTLPGVRREAPRFSPASASTGAELFRVKGCAQCHQGKSALEGRPGDRSMTDLSAALWNHGSRLERAAPALSMEEMRRLVGYLWTIQFFNQPGDSAKGRRVFEAKGCGNCHGQSAPDLRKQNLSPFEMVAGLWRHGADMQRAMEQHKRAWPRFEGTQMANLLAYLNAK